MINKQNNMSWKRNGKIFKHDGKSFGFIYKIELPTGEYYIGQKMFTNDNKRIVGKRELLEKGKTNFRKYKSKSGKTKGQWIYYEDGSKETWQDYWGSEKSGAINAARKKYGDKSIKREILCTVKDKISLSYWETYYLFANNCLLDDKCLNKNILGRYFQGKIKGCE